MSRRLRLLKVIVQPVFVIDDDEEGLKEVVAEPVAVTAKDWPTYPTSGFVEAFEELREALDARDE